MPASRLSAAWPRTRAFVGGAAAAGTWLLLVLALAAVLAGAIASCGRDGLFTRRVDLDLAFCRGDAVTRVDAAVAPLRQAGVAIDVRFESPKVDAGGPTDRQRIVIEVRYRSLFAFAGDSFADPRWATALRAAPCQPVAVRTSGGMAAAPTWMLQLSFYIACLAAFALYKRLRVTAPRLAGVPTRHALRPLIVGMSCVLAWAVAMALLAYWLDMERPDERDRWLYAQARGRPWLWLALLLATPAAEEALFRGTMLGEFVRRGLPWAGVVFVSVAFASLHTWAIGGALQRPYEFVSLLGVSVGFGWIMLRTRRLVFPFVAHATYNAVAFALRALA